MSRPSCSSRGLGGLGTGPVAGAGSPPSAFDCGCSVISRVSQFQPTDPLLGQSPTMTVERDRSSSSGSLQARARGEAPDRNLALELVRVTEAGAMAAGRWVGRGDKEGGDGAAVDAIRELVNTVSMRGVVVIGEGEKDQAPMLYNGEEVGNGDGPECDFAVDPIDGTTLMSKGLSNAISVLAVAERGAMYDPSAVFYMNKIAVGSDAVDAIDITAPIGDNIRRVAKVKSLSVSDMTVCILDRPRHVRLIADVRAAGARCRLISDGDVAGAVSGG